MSTENPFLRYSHESLLTVKRYRCNPAFMDSRRVTRVYADSIKNDLYDDLKEERDNLDETAKRLRSRFTRSNRYISQLEKSLSTVQSINQSLRGTIERHRREYDQNRPGGIESLGYQYDRQRLYRPFDYQTPYYVERGPLTQATNRYRSRESRTTTQPLKSRKVSSRQPKPFGF